MRGQRDHLVWGVAGACGYHRAGWDSPMCSGGVRVPRAGRGVAVGWGGELGFRRGVGLGGAPRR